MFRFYLAAADMLPGAVLLAPVFFLLNRVYFHNAGKSILYYLFSCYLAVVYVLVGMPNVTYIRPEVNLNLIPFAGMIDDWKNSILNILLFIPLGAALPVLWKNYRTAGIAVLSGFGMSLVIELLQMLTFRASDVNDLITNTLGTFLGYLCARAMQKKFPATERFANHTRTVDLAIILTVVLFVMFFAYPFASAALWDLIYA